MSRTAKTVAWNTIVQGLAKAVSLVLSLGVTMLLTRHLGVAGYGSFVAVFVYMTFFASFADWGTQTILVRELAQEPATFEQQVGAALTLRLGLSLSAALIAAATVPVFYSGQPQVLVGVVIALPTLLFGSISTTVAAAFQSQLRMGRVAVAEITAQLVSTGILAGLVFAGRPLREVIAATVLTGALQAAILLWLARSLVRIRPRLDLALSKRLLKRALPLGVALLLNTIYFRVDALILSTLGGASAIGVYGLAYRVCEAIIGFSTIFIASMFPLLAAAAREADVGSLRRLTQRGFDVLVLAAVPAALGVIALAPQVVGFVAGDHFESAVPVLRVLVVGAALMFVTGLLGHVLVAVDRQKSAMLINVAGLVLNVVLNLTLIPRFGALAAASAGTASEGFVLGCGLWLIRKHAGFTPNFRLGRRAVAAGLAMAIVLSLAGAELFASIALGVVVYAAALWAVRAHRSLELRPLAAAKS